MNKFVIFLVSSRNRVLIHALKVRRVYGRKNKSLFLRHPGLGQLISWTRNGRCNDGLHPCSLCHRQVASNFRDGRFSRGWYYLELRTPITKWNYQITKASETPMEVFAKSIFMLPVKRGRPGVRLIDITKKRLSLKMMRFFSYPKKFIIKKQFLADFLKVNNEQIIKNSGEIINRAKKNHFLSSAIGVSIIESAEKRINESGQRSSRDRSPRLFLGLGAFPGW